MSKGRLISVARRQFVEGIGAVTGVVMFGRAGVGRGATENRGAAIYVPRALQAGELSSLKAIMSRLIPADRASGGAVEAQAHVYVDRALGGAYAVHLPVYRRGLAVLNALARNQGATSLETLPAKDMDALIAQLEQGGIEAQVGVGENAGSSLPGGGKPFFSLVRQHTIEGMFGDPMYGGNQEFLGWRLLGYSGVQFYYSSGAQAINGKHTHPNHSSADFGGEPAS